MSDLSESFKNMHWKRNNNKQKKSSSSSSSRRSLSKKRKSRNFSKSVSRSRSYSQSISSDQKSTNQKNIKGKTGPSLNYHLLIEKEYVNYFTSNNEELLRSIESSISGGNVKIYFDYNFFLQDLDGKVLVVESNDLLMKREAIKLILEHLRNINSKSKNDEKYEDSSTKALILVPNGLVSIIIGTRGKQINNLIFDSGANIIVNQPIFKMFHRTITITGKISKVANAVMLIYKTMEDRYYEVEFAEVECKPLDIRKQKTSAKFVFNQNCIEFLKEKRSSFIKHLEKSFGISVKIYNDRSYRILAKNEHVLYIKGRVQEVQDATVITLKKLSYYCKEDYNGKESYLVKMLVPRIYVTKLIGVGGCMIKKLSHASGGAMIKILSEKNREEISPEIAVSIAGSIGQVQDASCLILEQIECFKNGGPVLATGKSIHKNIAQQFDDSIVINDKEKHEEHEMKQKKRKRSKSKSRSKSVSKSKKQVKVDSKIKFDQIIINIDNQKSVDIKNRIFEEKGELKISNDIIIPDHLLFSFTGKNSDVLKMIMSKTGATIFIQDDNKAKTFDNISGKVCNIKGTSLQAGQAVQLISDTIMKIESNLSIERKK